MDQNLKLAVSSYSFLGAVRRGMLSYDDILPKAKEMGFAGVEYAGLELPAGMTAEEYAEALREKAKALQLELTCYSVGANFLSPDPEGETERVKAEVRIAQRLGVKYMRHDVCYAPMPGGRRSFEANLPLLVKCVRSVTEYAESLGIKTMVENHGMFCQDSHRVEMLIDAVDSPNYGALIDLGNFLCADEDPAKAAGILKEYAFYIHCKDFYYKEGAGRRAAPEGPGWIRTRGGNYIKGAAVGDGCVPVAKCLGILRDAGFRGVTAIEYEGTEDPLECIAAGKRYLEKTID